MLKNSIRIVVAALAFSAGPLTAFGQGALQSAIPAPKLNFSPFEMALAQEVSKDPGLASFYGASGLRPVFAGDAAEPHRAALREAVSEAPEHGLPLRRYQTVLPDDSQALSPAKAAEHEAAYARLFAMWARDVSSGVVEPHRIDRDNKRRPRRPDFISLLRDFAASPEPKTVLDALPPDDPRYLRMQEILRENLALIPADDVAKVPGGFYRAGDRSDAVALLRARLASIGFDSPGSADPMLFDEPLDQAVRAYQTRAGLGADGLVGKGTLGRLNQGPGPQSRALMVSLERMRWLNEYDLQARHVWVNLPSFVARIREGGKDVFATRVVIGKTDSTHRTPEFSDEMEFVVANPRWNVPASITAREYLPRLKENPNAVAHLDVVDRRGKVVPRENIDFSKYSEASFPYRLRQKPSDNNALGKVKFIFPNRWNIYLHDTPSKGLFSRGTRAFSHGCVRIGRPFELAYELLRPQTRDPRGVFQRALNTGEERWLKLKPGLPVHLVYFTALPDDNGKLRRYGDIYGRDQRVWRALVAAGEP